MSTTPLTDPQLASVMAAAGLPATVEALASVLTQATPVLLGQAYGQQVSALAQQINAGSLAVRKLLQAAQSAASQNPLPAVPTWLQFVQAFAGSDPTVSVTAAPLPTAAAAAKAGG